MWPGRGRRQALQAVGWIGCREVSDDGFGLVHSGEVGRLHNNDLKNKFMVKRLVLKT